MKKMQHYLKKTLSILISVSLISAMINFPVYAGVYKTSTKRTTNAVLAKPYFSPAKVSKMTNQNIKIINEVSKNKKTSSLAKKWLKEAKKLIKKTLKSKKSNAKKYKLLKKALSAIKAISKAKGSDLSLAQQTAASGSFFSSLKKVLKNNITYKLYVKYVKPSITLIDKLLKSGNVKNSVAKEWLKKAKGLINNVINGKTKLDIRAFKEAMINEFKNNKSLSSTLTFSQNSLKDFWLRSALNSIKAISKNNASIESIIEQTPQYGKAFTLLFDWLSFKSVYDMYDNYVEKSISIVNFLKKNNTDGLKQTWLTKAAALISKVLNGNQSDSEKTSWLKKALTSLEAVSKENASAYSLFEQTISGAFGSLKTVFDNNTTYTLYKDYVSKSLNIINNLLSKNTIGSFEKVWLKKAADLINNILNGNQSDDKKESLLKQALTSLTKVSQQKDTEQILKQESAEGSVFSSLAILTKIYEKYSREGLEIIEKLADRLANLNVTADMIYEQFVNFGVERLELYKMYKQTAENGWPFPSNFMNQLDTNYKFFNCGQLALSKYLNMDKGLITVQHIAADISVCAWTYIGECYEAIPKVMQINGRQNTNRYGTSLENLMNILQDGEGAIMLVNIYKWFIDEHTINHGILVTKEKDNTFGVCDINVNAGNKIIYSKEEFIKLMTLGNSQGSDSVTVTGTDAQTGQVKTNKIYYTALTDNNGKLDFVSDAQGLITNSNVEKRNISFIDLSNSIYVTAYSKYGYAVFDFIGGISERLNLSEDTEYKIYKKFIDTGITKEEIENANKVLSTVKYEQNWLQLFYNKSNSSVLNLAIQQVLAS